MITIWHSPAELLTGYGDIFSVWLDGACGEGPNGKKQVYDWNRYYECVRKYQPETHVSVCAGQISDSVNEAGDVRKSEWSVVHARTALAEIITGKEASRPMMGNSGMRPDYQ